MKLPVRKPTRLKDYDYSSNGLYFITICTVDRSEILSEIVGDDAYIVPQNRLTSFGTVAEKYIQSIPGIDQYVIMPNHIHLIIRIDTESPPPVQSVSQRIQSFKTLVAKALGASIFQRSFHDHIIRNRQEYETIWRYIETNPSKWEDDCFHKNNL